MLIGYKFKYTEGDNFFYAIGEKTVVKECCSKTFSNLEWKAKWKEDKIIHYPGGWMDRAASGYSRGGNIMDAIIPNSGPFPDQFWIEVGLTNNPQVTLLQTHVYRKVCRFNMNRIQQQYECFFDSISAAFNLYEVPLVPSDRWSDVTRQYPQLRCAPVW